MHLRLTKMLKDEDIKHHFENMATSRQNIVKFCESLYTRQSSKKGSLISPNRLDTLVKRVGRVLKLSKSVINSALNSLYHVKMGFRIRDGTRVNVAPIFHPNQHLRLIWKMWSRPQSSIPKLFAMQSAAIQALICLHTGRRWVDATRLRWELVRFQKVRQRTFCKIPVAMSKGNKGVRNEIIAFQQNNTKTCPVRLLKEFWHIQGCPSSGFIFPCIAKRRKFTKGLFQHWDAYTCKGHGKSSKADLIDCLGQVNGITSFGYYQRSAKAEKWKVLPHKHSFRRGAVVMAHAVGLSRDRITEIFGWTHNSNMPSHYLSNELVTTKQSLAWNIADQMHPDQKFQCLKGVNFAN